MDGYLFAQECGGAQKPYGAGTLADFFSANNPRPESYSFTACSRPFEALLKVRQPLSSAGLIEDANYGDPSGVRHTLCQIVDKVCGRSKSGPGRKLGRLRVRDLPPLFWRDASSMKSAGPTDSLP